MSTLPPFGSAHPVPLNALSVLRTSLCCSWLVLCCVACDPEPARAPDHAQGKPAPVGEQVEKYAALSSAFTAVIRRKAAAISPAQGARVRALLDSLRQAPTTPAGREMRARILGFASAAEQRRRHSAVIDARQAARRQNPAFFTQSPQAYRQWWLDYHQAHRSDSVAENH